MFGDQSLFMYAFLHPDFFEDLVNYPPGSGYRATVTGMVPAGWEVEVRGFWTSAKPPDCQYIQQGWKIHISAVPWTAQETLERTVPLLAGYGVAFKFVSDEVMLELSLSKSWARSGAGKFMTVYPRDEEEFLAIIEELHQRTAGLRGPYILSDRAYKDSRVVYYRYGEHLSRRRVEPTGILTPLIEAPDGSWHSDQRTGYFQLPAWVRDPVCKLPPLAAPGEAGVFLQGRYHVQSALRFGAMGGIYRAVDTHTNREVVIREARPLLGTTSLESDSFQLLRKEARILQRLGSTGLLPEFVDLFQEWEHLFLVQEKIAGDTLWGHAMGFYFLHPQITSAESFARFRETALKLVAALQTIHAHGVILRDLTRSNTLVTPEGDVRFIDLESSHEIGTQDTLLMIQTPGYASPQQIRSSQPSFQDDHYSLGALLLDIISFTASGLDANRPGIFQAFELTLRDLRFPAGLSDLVQGLTHRDPAQRWDLGRAGEFLRHLPEPQDHRTLIHQLHTVPERPRPSEELRSRVRETLDGMVRFIHAKTRLAREDTLWPSSAEVFFTNPVNLQYGAAGTAFFLLRAEGKVSGEVLDWIERRAELDPCPPGLARGLAGVALLLLESGRQERAIQFLDLAARSPLLEQEKGLYLGAAGWGLTQLHFWHRLAQPRFLDEAERIGKLLAKTAHRSPAGATWAAMPEKSPHGLFDGPSGVGLFLLHLAAATEKREFLDLALEGLRFDLEHRQELGAHVLWFPYTNAAPGEPKSPHLSFGTAGIGPVLLRAYALTGDPELRAWAERCAVSVSERLTNKIWQDFGMAGYGELLLDFYTYLGDEKYLNAAFHLAESLLLYRIPREGGYAFAGQEHYRLCCDYGWGSAGIGMFLQRLLEPSTPRLLMIDGLLTARAAERSHFAAGPELVTAD
jgi:serine/threonine protein kinase